jgi:hypothetical protein
MALKVLSARHLERYGEDRLNYINGSSELNKYIQRMANALMLNYSKN